MKRLYAFAASLGLCVATPTFAADDWWFDIEVIIFDRNVSMSELNEQFAENLSLSPAVANLNLIDNYLRPNISAIKQGLATCGVPDNPLWLDTPSIDSIINTHKQWEQSQQQVYSADEGSTASTAAALQSDTATTYNEQTREEALAAAFSENDDDVVADEPSTTQDHVMNKVDGYQPAIDTVSANEIAEYWVSFSGINDVEPVSVPALRYCEPHHDWLTYEDGKWRAYKPDNALPAPSVVPEFLDGRDWPDSPVAHLLPYDSLALTKLSRQIRQTRGLNRLLHVAWRQPVKFGEKQADAMRIIAGENYAERFTESGEAITQVSMPEPEIATSQQDTLSLSQDAFFTNLTSRLRSAKPVSFSDIMAVAPQQTLENEAQPQSVAQVNEGAQQAIWELDGYLKVYLKYINRVPYLHIDSEMQYRQPVAVKDGSDLSAPLQYELQAVPFHQVRRVISKQIHYFDHPLFGMIVEIRRHQR